MSKSVIILKELYHRGAQRIALYFDYDKKLVEQIKKIEGVKWSQSNKCW
ncbi:MAG: integrase, partial [Chlorobi bacterium]|nr:integrase [Chlorobiota bacterium]